MKSAPTPDLLTFGCRLNIADSERLRPLLDAAPGRDLVVFNGCGVTGEAVRQLRQAIRRARRERPTARLVVTGCAAETDGAALAAMPEVDAVVPNRTKLDCATWGVGALSIPRELFRPRSRAFVEVQTGCDHRCTFCVIPLGRGPSRSVPARDVLSRVRAKVEAGYREVVLTGVDVTDYRDEAGGASGLGDLVRSLLRELPDLPRLRLSSLDAVDVDATLLDLFATEERLMPHIHLSLQSGDDMILRRMKRRHRRADALTLVRRLKALRPGIAVGADLIAGFPTEDEAMFARSLGLVEEAEIVHLHVFPFSARPQAPASRMPPVPAPVVRERAALLRDAGARVRAGRLRAEIGRRETVLAERGGMGHTPAFLPVGLPAAMHAGEIGAVTLAADGRGGLVAA